MFLLSDLVRATFIASTSYSDQLRREGLSALQMIIHVFCGTLDPDYDNHALLEQYQAQVGAALRPAFEDDTPPDVTSMACQVSNQRILILNTILTILYLMFGFFYFCVCPYCSYALSIRIYADISYL